MSSRLIPDGDTETIHAWLGDRVSEAPAGAAPPRPASPPPPPPEAEPAAAVPDAGHGPFGASPIETHVLADVHDATSVRSPFEPAEDEATAFHVPAPAGGAARWLRIAAVTLVLAGGGWAVWARWLSPLAHPGTVVIETRPPDSEVYVDGTPGGTTPVTLTLTPGNHTVELRRKGLSQLVTLSIRTGRAHRQADSTGPRSCRPGR